MSMIDGMHNQMERAYYADADEKLKVKFMV